MIDWLKGIWVRICWRPNFLTFIELLLLLSVYPLLIYGNPQWFVEDGVVENLQLLICLGCFLVAWCSPHDKDMFRFIALIVILLICREVNTGRHWLCTYYDLSYDSRWEEIPYGYVLKWGHNLFAVAIVLYFLVRKIYRPLWHYVQKAPLYFWEFLFLVVGAILALLAEKPIDNETLEEIAETLFYVALLNLIWRYVRHRKVLN